MEGFWGFAAAVIGATGIAGGLTRLLLRGKAHRLKGSIEQATEALKLLPEEESAARDALMLARRTDAVTLATLSLLPAQRVWRTPVIASVMITAVLIAVAGVVTSTLPMAEVQPRVLEGLLAAFGAASVLSTVGTVLLGAHAIDSARESFIDEAMVTGSLDWRTVRIHRQSRMTRQLLDARRARRARGASGAAPRSLPTGQEGSAL